MSNVWYIARRQLLSTLRSPAGYIIIAAVLAVEGLLFNAFALGSGAKRSSEVLEAFFYTASGTTILGSIFLAMGLIAEERQNATLVLLSTSPVRDWQLVLGKYTAAMSFVALMVLATVYMPALVMVNGKVSFGHLVAGYLGLLLIASATVALVLLCSALAPNQLVAAIVGSAVVATFVLLWALSRIADPPLEDLLAYVSLHDKHFRPFMRGIVSTQDVLFYLSLTWVALAASTRVLEARRWR